MMNDFSIRIEGNEGRTHCPFCTVIPDTETTRINDFAVIYDTENRIIGNETVDNHPSTLLLLRERACRTQLYCLRALPRSCLVSGQF